MKEAAEFDVFAQAESGPIWRGSFSDLNSAKAKAKTLATQEGLEFFVFSYSGAREVARFFPKPKQGGLEV